MLIRTLILAVVASSALAVSQAPAAATAVACNYAANRLPGFPGGTERSWITDTDGGRHFIGVGFGGTAFDPYPRGMVWLDGQVVASFGALSTTTGVNRAGEAIGFGVGSTQAVLLRGGAFTRLAWPAQATRSVPTPASISDDGVIVGTVRFDDGTYHGLLWTVGTAGTTVRDLGVVGISGALREISDTGGRVAGAIRSGTRLRAVTGPVDALTPLPGVSSDVDSEATDIAGRFILGTGTIPGSGTGTVLWDNGVPRLILTDGTATDVNSQGLVVGHRTVNGRDEAFAVTGGVRTTLAPLPGHAVARALTVTEDGRIAGWSGNDSASAVPVVWSCA